MGRAGRPQFDDSAVAVLLVHAPKKEFLKRMLFSPFPIESHLIERVHNMLMAEVCATRSISDKEDAVNYMRCTFFYQRLRQNPTYYKLEDAHQDEAVLTFLRDLIDVTFDDLAAAGAIQLDEDRFSVAPATLGRIASYVLHCACVIFYALSFGKVLLLGLPYDARCERVVGAYRRRCFVSVPAHGNFS